MQFHLQLSSINLKIINNGKNGEFNRLHKLSRPTYCFDRIKKVIPQIQEDHLQKGYFKLIEKCSINRYSVVFL